MALIAAIIGLVIGVIFGFFIGRRFWPRGISITNFGRIVLSLFVILILLNIFVFQLGTTALYTFFIITLILFAVLFLTRWFTSSDN